MTENARTDGPSMHIVRIAAVALAYAGAALLGFAAAGAENAVTAVWPAGAVAVAAAVVWGRGIWPGIAIGAFAANLLNGSPVITAGAIAVGNTAAPLLAATALRRLDFRASMSRVRDVVTLVVAGMGAMVVSATLGVAALAVFGNVVTVDTWIVWWVGDAFGVALFAPVLLTAAANDRQLRRRWVQAVILLGSLAIATTLAVVTDSPVGFAVVPLAVAAALQLEMQGAAIAALIMTVIDVTAEVMNVPMGAVRDTELMQMQAINLTLAFILLALGAMMHERRRAQARLEEAAIELEHHVAERTAELVAANSQLEREVEERRITEEALRASRERLSEAQRLAHIGSFTWDLRSDVLTWSEEMYRIYGVEIGTAPPRFEAYNEFIRADVRDEVADAIQLGIESGQSQNHEYPIVLRDGRKKWVQSFVEVVKDADGTVTHLRGTCQDVTERKVSEAALRWSEGRFRALLESAPDAVIVVDPRGKIVLSNRQTSKILGYERDELLGQSVEMLLPTDLREQHSEHRQLYNAQPGARMMGSGTDLYALRKDGTKVAVDVSLSPVETDSGFLVFALLRDASERRRVEDALRTALDREREASEDLRKLDRAKNAFLSAVSHELRTPLTAILGFAELLEEPNVKENPEMTSELVGRVRFSANRLNDLLVDLLDLDRLHRGVVSPRRRATSLRSLVQRALIGLDLGTHQLSAEVDDAIVQVDPAQAERIIENLISNAVRYTPPGTAIYLCASASTNNGVNLKVEDEGPGVAKELWPTIFDPFVRGDTGTFTQGTGIGLSLVDRFARLHGGFAEVGDRAGGGAVFRVVLPGPHEPVHAAVA